VTDRPDRPLSSDEMLEQFRNRVEHGELPISSEQVVEEPALRHAEPPVPTPRRRRPLQPEASSPPAHDRRTRSSPRSPSVAEQKRLAIAISVALALVLLGLVAAVVFAQGT